MSVRYYHCTIERVIDGDTLFVAVDLGFEVYSYVTIRLHGVDTPEMNTKEGREAKAKVAEWLEFPKELQRHTLISYREKDKYGRRVCDIKHCKTGQLLSVWLLNNDLARPWPPPKRSVSDG